jgi:DNA-binding beta-propeller fold protein YncE
MGIPLAVQFLWEVDGGDDRLRGVRALAVDGAGNVYVQDAFNHRIVKFDPAGIYLGEFGGRGTRPGQFNQVGQVALDGQGNIYVADQFNNRVQKFRLP